MSYSAGVVKRPGSSSGVIAPVQTSANQPRPAEISHKINQIKSEFDHAFLRIAESLYQPLMEDQAAEDASRLLRRIAQLEMLLERTGLKYLSLKNDEGIQTAISQLGKLKEESGLINLRLQHVVSNSKNVQEHWEKSIPKK